MQEIKKPWGHELIWAHTPHYVGKTLYIKEGHKLSRQYHVKKDETILVLQGNLVLELEETSQVLGPQESHHIPAGTVHRFCASARSDVTLVEVSTPELEDVVRLCDDYGRITSERLAKMLDLDYDDS
jgi:mannose-6-phosphate isomerase-like protein (cupin superfamily)